MNFLKEIDESWTLFLDRDGVINHRLLDDYVTDVEQFEFLPGVLEALYLLKDRFYKIIVVTNQQGIGKDLMTIEDLEAIHHYMLSEVESAFGHIDQIYFAPGLAYLDDQFRKPAPGMALQAQADYPHINFQKSIMVGDSSSDIAFGRNLDMKTVFVTDKKNAIIKADIQVSSLLRFAQLIS